MNEPCRYFTRHCASTRLLEISPRNCRSGRVRKDLRSPSKLTPNDNVQAIPRVYLSTLLSRFLICRRADGPLSHQSDAALRALLPKLSLVVIAQYDNNSRHPRNFCQLQLLGPLHASTVFNVIAKTPLYNTPASSIRAPWAASRISVSLDGRLIPDSSSMTRSSAVRLESTSIRSLNPDEILVNTDADTMIELMRIAGRQDAAENIQEGGQTRRQGPHMVRQMYREELEAFVKDVRGLCLTERYPADPSSPYSWR